MNITYAGEYLAHNLNNQPRNLYPQSNKRTLFAKTEGFLVVY